MGSATGLCLKLHKVINGRRPRVPKLPTTIFGVISR